eukprot:4712717-Amphidinium_carterae.1
MPVARHSYSEVLYLPNLMVRHMVSATRIPYKAHQRQSCNVLVSLTQNCRRPVLDKCTGQCAKKTIASESFVPLA